MIIRYRSQFFDLVYVAPFYNFLNDTILAHQSKTNKTSVIPFFSSSNLRTSFLPAYALWGVNIYSKQATELIITLSLFLFCYNINTISFMLTGFRENSVWVKVIQRKSTAYNKHNVFYNIWQDGHVFLCFIQTFLLGAIITVS